ncbi:hypothetical protein H2198_008378 [Neophaeococcomyces mojaviensis]|uniref:Uncharacterized protein n=1 Tax=Neophaeococcomyces mojaviensis TaxID=3383035 RepID=A0ACC2ZXL3_9EURO|nr:hypothetical protein H2198_008378 [Knufia sp. JES_112]
MTELNVNQTKGMAFSADIPSETRELFIAYDDWKCRSVTIVTFNGDCPTTIYTVDLHMRKPNVVIRSASPVPTTIANISFHSFMAKVDIECYPESLDTHGITLQPKSAWSIKREYTYCSPSLNNAVMTWQSLGSVMKPYDFVLLDNSAMPLAQFIAAGSRFILDPKKIGKIELMPSIADKKDIVDEIVVTIFAIAQFFITQSRGANIAAVAAATS